jgi:uncharacterized membrane protein YphA (DoxX/SURF4 family)
MRTVVRYSGSGKDDAMTVQVYPKPLIVFAIILGLGLVIGAWSVAAAWRIGMIVAVAAVIVQRFRGKRLTTKF